MNSDTIPASSNHSAEEIAYNTHTEISGQPQLWREIFANIDWQKQAKDFLNPLLSLEDLHIVLTGAGTSAFIGEVIEPLIGTILKKHTRALPTTLLVTHFKEYIDIDKPTLFISFARSGNSPESVAVMDLAEKHCKAPYHITITCNSAGNLALKTKNLTNSLSIVLPEQAEDKSLAMTGSFTGMVLAGLLTSDAINQKIRKEHVEQISANAEIILKTYSDFFRKLSKKPFERIIFLGSGPLCAIARESHLKVQELTDGEVVGKYDSFLGFRHGPRAVSNSETVVVCLFSSNLDVFRYEKDLAEELIKNKYAKIVLGIFPSKDQADMISFGTQNEKIIMDAVSEPMLPELEIIPYVIPAQLIGYYKSIQLGLNPDNPSRSGSISRVVKGVKIYDSPSKE
ncbi:MAG: SIS domain-containing protein [Balneolaceae bacterium]|nr:SIS domain-containing protein [Balneolaceae bacterium]MCH8548434.1 SIS domain-containing protein [Balneolaceae bacterium]